MPQPTASGRKTPLSDITHRPLGARRSGNSQAPHIFSLTCSAPGEENNPARGLLEIFAAAQANSINRKRSLKLTGDDSEPQCISPTLSSTLTVFALHVVANEARNLAVGDEDGTIHIVDTKKDDSHPVRTVQILAHQNAIFDLCWTSDDSKIISVSGDKTARIHDVETKKCLGTFSGHGGSIKSVSLKHNDDNVFATAARDGAVLIWDIRCSGTTSAQGDTVYRPANRLLNVHANTTRQVPPKRTKHGSDGPNTASAVQYMKHNEHIIASTGALDGSVKYWDVRKHGTYFKHDYPKPLQTSSYTPLTKRAHGMTSMALSPDGSALFAVSSDNHIYMYNTTSLCGPVECFGGSNFTCSSYYIKISVSPDGNYIAAGSSKDLYVWEVNRPDKKPLIFHGHESEVTGVDWAKDLGNGTQTMQRCGRGGRIGNSYKNACRIKAFRTCMAWCPNDNARKE
ncbi:hypothetical protein BGZ68_001311 [Mortierella alpina]|nr:hypothetical protein BGZ68_001311 [Mortierella alpina]